MKVLGYESVSFPSFNRSPRDYGADGKGAKTDKLTLPSSTGQANHSPDTDSETGQQATLLLRPQLHQQPLFHVFDGCIGDFLYGVFN